LLAPQQHQRQQQQQQQQQTPPQPPPAEEANNSDGDRSSADDGRPQYFIRNSDSSDTSGNDSSDDSSFDSSGAGAESAGDSPQGKSGVVQSRRDGGFYLLYPTGTRRTERERKRETRKLNGECSVVEGPSGECPQGRQKPRSVTP
jgi:hypothetical protein